MTARTAARFSIAVAVGACVAGSAAPVANANHGTLQRVSFGPAGGNGTFTASAPGASADLTRVFVHTSERLVAADTDSVQDIYERSGSTTTLLSTGPAGGNGALAATFAGASQDGTRVFFTTAESLIASDTDSAADLYQRSGSTTTHLSIGGSSGISVTFAGASQDGTRVFFRTSESLVAADTDSAQDIYERSGSTTTLLSTGPAGGNGALAASFAGASQDGTRVFFTTAESLVGGDTDSVGDLYERSGSTTTLLSTGPAGGNGALAATFAGASQDGTRVFFHTDEPLVAGDLDAQPDVYQRSGSTTTLLSTGPAGGNGAFAAEFTRASSDGTRVHFNTSEPLVAADTDSFQDIYERSGSTTTLLSTGPAGGNGAFHAFFSGASADGSRVVFATNESLLAGDLDAEQDIYERSGSTTTLLSTGPAGGNGAFPASFARASQDGMRVFFNTSESLVAADTDSSADVYERFLGATTQLSFGLTGGNGAFGVSGTAASLDGTRYLYATNEALVPGDTDGSQDLYVAGLANTANYPRPGSATPTRVALVPAYEQCTDPNSRHAAPGQDLSCNPPQLVSDFLTVGTTGQSSGFVRLDALVGTVGGPDDADIAIETFLSDVRNASGGSDYSGKVKVSLDLRITDRLSGPSSSDPATVEDNALEFAVECTPTGGSAGATCSTTTSADALVPGYVKESKRSIFHVDNVSVFDGGADGDVDSDPNTLFAWEGVFVP